MKKLWLWSLERFPAVNLLAAVMTYMVAAVWARRAMGLPPVEGAVDVAGCAVVFLHLLLLRVIDEHKDDAWDRQNHPERLLQKGVVTLMDLRRLGYVAFALQIALILWRSQTSGLAAVGALLAWAWTGLMTVEFFLGERLRRRILVYSVSHLLLSPFLILWSSMWATGSAPRLTPLVFVMGCSFFASLSYEFARKSKGREEEVPKEPSYSNSFGRMVPPLLIFAASLFLCLSKISLLQEERPAWLTVSFGVSFVMMAALVLFLKKYASQPTKKARKVNEGWVTLIGLEVFVTALVAALV